MLCNHSTKWQHILQLRQLATTSTHETQQRKHSSHKCVFSTNSQWSQEWRSGVSVRFHMGRENLNCPIRHWLVSVSWWWCINHAKSPWKWIACERQGVFCWVWYHMRTKEEDDKKKEFPILEFFRDTVYSKLDRRADELIRKMNKIIIMRSQHNNTKTILLKTLYKLFMINNLNNLGI